MNLDADKSTAFDCQFKDKIGTGPSRFVLQRLKHDGHPFGEPVIAVDRRATPADVSNRIDGDRRFALYNNPTLRLLVLKADTLEKVGDSVRIAAYAGFGDQTAVLDPLGRFAVYVTRTGHPLGERLLMFQALDVLGHPSGQPRIIAERVTGGLDVLKETTSSD